MGKGRGGIPGGYGGMNMQQLMMKAQKMSQQMEKSMDELAEKDFESTAGGGAVKVLAKGSRLISEITIAPSAVDPDDIEMLQDMIIAAVNDVMTQIDKEQNAIENSMKGFM